MRFVISSTSGDLGYFSEFKIEEKEYKETTYTNVRERPYYVTTTLEPTIEISAEQFFDFARKHELILNHKEKYGDDLELEVYDTYRE